MISNSQRFQKSDRRSCFLGGRRYILLSCRNVFDFGLLLYRKMRLGQGKADLFICPLLLSPGLTGGSSYSKTTSP